MVAELVGEALAGNQTRACEIEIEESEHTAPGQAPGEMLQLVEFSRDITPADHRSDRCADDDVRFQTGLLEYLQDPDM